ncbi:MAG TPA: ABC transporter ATP-binding protein [Trueperaceae bacterium]|jgi:putative ABC transport system ATP-binding protein|nr:ABC transporter ATP-binding protein [Trueperaceae bacterium]
MPEKLAEGARSGQLPAGRFALAATDLHKTYYLGEERIAALQGVTLVVPRGQFVAVMGPSGSGKSTLLHMVGLLDVPDSGTVAIEGRPTTGMSDDELTALRRDRLGFLFQSFELIPNLTARENILLPAEVAGRREQAEKRLTELAARLGIAERLGHRPRQLSGGQRQRVALARALINDPAVVLADEPTGNLDSKTGAEVLALLREGVDQHGWTVVMVTHDPVAAQTADRVVFLRDGRVAGETAGPQVKADVERFLSA